MNTQYREYIAVRLRSEAAASPLAGKLDLQALIALADETRRRSSLYMERIGSLGYAPEIQTRLIEILCRNDLVAFWAVIGAREPALAAAADYVEAVNNLLGNFNATAKPPGPARPGEATPGEATPGEATPGETERESRLRLNIAAECDALIGEILARFTCCEEAESFRHSADAIRAVLGEKEMV